MHFIAAAKIPFEQVDPAAAVSEAQRLLERAAEPTTGVVTNVRLLAADGATPLDAAALTDRPFEEVVDPLKATLAQSACSLDLRLTGFRWCGAPQDSVSELRIITLHAPRPTAPVVRAVLRGQAEDPKRETKTIFKSVRARTGLEFKLEEVKPSAEEVLTPAHHAVVRVCLREAMERTRPLVEPLLARELPFLHADQSSAFNQRVAARLGGVSAKVNADRHFRQLLVPRGFTARKGSESAVFTRGLTERLEIGVVFDKVHHWGLGKSFKVLIALVDRYSLLDRHVRPLAEEDVTALFLDWPTPQFARAWAYSTEGELVAALVGIGALLDTVLPPLEAELTRLVDGRLGAELPTGVQRRVIDWRPSLEVAELLARKWKPNAALLRVVFDPEGQPSAPEPATWVFCFAVGADWLEIVVPSAGPLRTHQSRGGAADSPRLAGRKALERASAFAGGDEGLAKTGLRLGADRGRWHLWLAHRTRYQLDATGKFVEA